MNQNACALGILIKNQLNRLEKNQSWLAQQCDVTRGQISHIIVGRCKPSFRMITALSDSLDIDENTLIRTAYLD